MTYTDISVMHRVEQVVDVERLFVRGNNHTHEHHEHTQQSRISPARILAAALSEVMVYESLDSFSPTLSD